MSQRTLAVLGCLVMFIVAALPGQAAAASLAGLRSSVFKIRVVANAPNFIEPWKKGAPQQSSGTGFYIGAGRILTNAHVIANASFITVLRDGDSRPLPAYVQFVGHDCDLAIIEVVDRAKLADVEPLELGGVPKLRSPVSTIGFPMGGEQLSITEGVVSRVSHRRYVHSGHARHLLVQVDSAINPGNSGGPVIQGRMVVGVAFQSYTQAQNTGYIIPTPVIDRFLKDVEDGHYDGHPDDGLTTNEWTMTNPSTAAFHGPEAEGAGVVVAHVATWATTAEVLRAGDRLLSIEGQAIGADGKVLFQGERVDFRTLFDLKQMGDTVRFKIERGGVVQQVVVAVRAAKRHHVPENIYAKHAKYFVYGGLVFTTLSRSLLTTWGAQWPKKAPLLLRFLDYYARFEPETASLTDIVVLSKRLPDVVNTYATGDIDGVVTEVDDAQVNSIEALAQALEKGSGKFAVIRFFGDDVPIVLSRAKVAARNAQINAKYGVAPDRWFKGAEDDGAITRQEAQQ